MSEKYTEVSTPHGGYGAWGHVPYVEACAALRAYYEAARDEAIATLADLEAGRVTVHHQRGVHRARDRVQVFM